MTPLLCLRIREHLLGAGTRTGKSTHELWEGENEDAGALELESEKV